MRMSKEKDFPEPLKEIPKTVYMESYSTYGITAGSATREIRVGGISFGLSICNGSSSTSEEVEAFRKFMAERKMLNP
ncbi:hypothetical protein [Paenibacillus sedimenti]|uniref:Uncharacterized protein n=1 Tax=Paenibacillus sedimenti TaxID=2770274 RepID=A0A926KNV6_9BACL|nr:hypothetical protein [Paenibacillus sedimenti]MBD0381302.1 hypothetical protein [Paenibacillus sedimenti]